MTTLEGRVGLATAADGAEDSVALSRDLAVLIQQAQGRYTELARRGRLFSASTGGAGVAPGTAMGTQPPFVLYNPVASGKILSILAARMGYISGTIGAGTIVWGFMIPGAQTVPPAGGTDLTEINHLGPGAASGVGQARQVPTALSSTPNILFPAFTLGAFLATTAMLMPPLVDEVDGLIAVQPGGLVCLQGIAAAGATPLVQLAVIWAEIDP